MDIVRGPSRPARLAGDYPFPLRVERGVDRINPPAECACLLKCGEISCATPIMSSLSSSNTAILG
jgi:hypothetical protein